MQLSLSSVFAAVTTLMLVARPVAACTPGTYSCLNQREGNEYESIIQVCDAAGNWQTSAVCATTYGHPGCRVVNGGQSAYCVP
ncbi:hypothetical protein C7999DRAFT_32333 [Corynascus novoguineensis]|uniref:Uncharacterized protein n=1 Tax=Corynascus novoguineensis TaxID=1126955 RepID=A0AAN7CSL8_9PEZI|nr:hypothetical protein C7999DRAFT_32333 [Corynascus novoguineensis]